MSELPRAMNHIGIGFPDIEAAVKWYRDVLGCYVLMPPADAVDDGSHLAQIQKGIFGERYGHMKVAHLVTADGVGIEMFQFVKPKAVVPDDTFEYWRTGIFHFCLTAPDIEETAAKVAAAGGKVFSAPWKIYDDEDYRGVYCQDPWGTVFELYSAPYQQCFSNRTKRDDRSDTR